MNAKIEEAVHYLDLAKECLQEAQEVVAPPPLVIVPPAPIEVGLQKPELFYDHIRGDAGELFPSMSEDQFKGVQIDLDTGAGKLPLGWMAYCLATDYHETGARMVGVREGLDVSDAWRKSHLRYYPWYGRGKVQLTWEDNYRSVGEKIGVDLISNPDKALELNVAAMILIRGMLEGWFTGKKLRDYIGRVPTREQYKNARQIINGHDRDDLIAGYAVVFEEALKQGEWL